MDSDIRLGEIVVLDTSPSALSNTISITQDPVPAAPRTVLQTTLIMAALCTAVFLAAIDTVILTTALPTIASDIDASSAGFAWIGSASMPLWSTSFDIFGRKPLLLLANTTLMLGSLISALAPSLAALLVGRAVQELGAGWLTVLVSITVSDLFAMRRRGLMLALIGSVWSFASTIGPVVGGALAERASWRWCFWVNR
jgi:MFS family permease